MDTATVRVVLKLQLDEVDAILKTLPRTSDSGVINGERVAFTAFRDELLKKWHNVHGQAFANSIIKEENASREAFKRLLSEEQQAERDHDMACRLAGKPVPQRPAVPNKRTAEEDPKSILVPNTFKRARVEDADEEDDESITPKKRAARLDPATLREDEDGRTKRVKCDKPGVEPLLDRHDRSTKATIFSATCSSCLDMHATHDMLQLPCKDDGDVEAHAYCRECLTRLFECSITDTSHFPPRCCSEIIPVFSCIPFLPPAVFSRFVAKREKLEMLDRTYCSNSTCSKWIRPVNIAAGIATCAECYQKTCVTCKKKQHDGLCLEDKDVKELMSVAKAKRWQTCPSCKEMVELDKGCYHITCRCQYEFCYICLAKWRTCKCPLWDERRIVDGPIPANNAPQNVANPANAVPPGPVARPNPPAPGPVPQPIVRAAQPQAQPQPQPQAANNQQANGRREKRRNRRRNNRAHVHDFKRSYRSEGHKTKCDRCGFEDRWANGCQGCHLMICRTCTKYRLAD